MTPLYEGAHFIVLRWLYAITFIEVILLSLKKRNASDFSFKLIIMHEIFEMLCWPLFNGFVNMNTLNMTFVYGLYILYRTFPKNLWWSKFGNIFNLKLILIIGIWIYGVTKVPIYNLTQVKVMGNACNKNDNGRRYKHMVWNCESCQLPHVFLVHCSLSTLKWNSWLPQRLWSLYGRLICTQ